MIVLRSSVTVQTSPVQPEVQERTFIYLTPVYSGQLLLHELDTLTPTITAVDTNGNPVTNLTVQAVTDNPAYGAKDLSRLGFTSGSQFTGTIILSK